MQEEEQTKEEEKIFLRLFGSMKAEIETQPLAMLADTRQLVFMLPESLPN